MYFKHFRVILCNIILRKFDDLKYKYKFDITSREYSLKINDHNHKNKKMSLKKHNFY